MHFAKTESITAVHSAFYTQFRTETRQCVGFVGCFGSKPELRPYLHQTLNVNRDS